MLLTLLFASGAEVTKTFNRTSEIMFDAVFLRIQQILSAMSGTSERRQMRVSAMLCVDASERYRGLIMSRRFWSFLRKYEGDVYQMKSVSKIERRMTHVWT